MIFLKALLFTLCFPLIAQSNSLDLTLGTVYDMSSYDQFGEALEDYTITSVTAVAMAQAEISSLIKRKFAWSACYERSENFPRSPFEKWIYHSFGESVVIDASVSGKKITINDISKAQQQADAALEQKIETEGKPGICDIVSYVRLEIEVLSKDGRIFRAFSPVTIKVNSSGEYEAHYRRWEFPEFQSYPMMQALPNSDSPITLYL